MNVGVLFSGGKDSSLAALLLSPFFHVELVSVSFGITPNDAPSIARMLGYSHTGVKLEEEYAMQAIETMVNDGYPNNGINFIHRVAIERVATLYEIVADGTRRDDRAPLLGRGDVRSLEDRLGIDYIRPLLGYGRSIIDALVEGHFEVVYGEGVSFDYEGELREIMATVYGPETVSNIFPAQHLQSKVTARRA